MPTRSRWPRCCCSTTRLARLPRRSGSTAKAGNAGCRVRPAPVEPPPPLAPLTPQAPSPPDVPETARGARPRCAACVADGRRVVMTVKIVSNEKGNPPGKLADAELHFSEGPLEGLKLIGFAVW